MSLSGASLAVDMILYPLCSNFVFALNFTAPYPITQSVRKVQSKDKIRTKRVIISCRRLVKHDTKTQTCVLEGGVPTAGH